MALSRCRRMPPSPDWPFLGVRRHCNGRRSINRMRGGPRRRPSVKGDHPRHASPSGIGRIQIQKQKSEAIPLSAPLFMAPRQSTAEAEVLAGVNDGCCNRRRQGRGGRRNSRCGTNSVMQVMIGHEGKSGTDRPRFLSKRVKIPDLCGLGLRPRSLRPGSKRSGLLVRWESSKCRGIARRREAVIANGAALIDLGWTPTYLRSIGDLPAGARGTNCTHAPGRNAGR